MTPIIYGISGLIVGALLTAVGFYLLLHRNLKRANQYNEKQLTQLQADHEALQNKLYREETQRQLDQQHFSKEKIKLEADLNQIQTAQATLTEQFTQSRAKWQETQQNQTQEVTHLQNYLRQVLAEKHELENKLTQQTAQWQREQQALEQETMQFREQSDRFYQEAQRLEKQLQEQREIWEQKHLELDMTVARTQNDKKNLENQLATIMKEKNARCRQEQQNVTDQVQQLRVDKQTLEHKLVVQTAQTQALEEEIEQLMERLLRVQHEDKSV